MMHSFKDLIPDALRRGRISREVAAVKITEAFNDLMDEQLPKNRKYDVRAISYKDKTLNVACRNAMAAHWVASREKDFIAALSRTAPEAPLVKIKPKNQTPNYDF